MANISAEEGLERVRVVRRSVEALEALALGRSAKLPDLIDREGGIDGLVRALVAFYRPRRDEIDRHEGSALWAPHVQDALEEFDESVRVYEAALYCAIVCLLENPSWNDAGGSCTAASLVKLFEPELSGVDDTDGVDWDERGLEVAVAVPGATCMFSFYDTLSLCASDLAVRDESGRFAECFELLSSYYELDHVAGPFEIHRSVEPCDFLDAMPDEVARMVDAYLFDRGLSPLGSDEGFAEVSAAIENAKRTVWTCVARLQGKVRRA